MSKKQELPITKTTIVEEPPAEQVKELASRVPDKPVIEYVVGFLFGPTRDQPDQVALIRKARPAWQAGKLNGIGGHVEPTDRDMYAAMRREFEEEAGADVQDWEYFATILFNTADFTAKVHFFKSFRQTTIISKTDEKVQWYSLLGFALCNEERISHLDFLIPLALEQHPVNDQIRAAGVHLE